MATKVHVLIAAHGEDPPEAVVLGVFAKYDEADRKRIEIDDRNTEYYSRVCEVAQKVSGDYKEWLKSVSLHYKTTVWPKDYLDKYHGVDHHIDSNSYLDRVMMYESTRKEFIEMTTSLCGDGPRPPCLPPIIQPPSGPLFYSWQMSIHEAIVE